MLLHGRTAEGWGKDQSIFVAFGSISSHYRIRVYQTIIGILRLMSEFRIFRKNNSQLTSSSLKQSKVPCALKTYFFKKAFIQKYPENIQLHDTEQFWAVIWETNASTLFWWSVVCPFLQPFANSKSGAVSGWQVVCLTQLAMCRMHSDLANCVVSRTRLQNRQYTYENIQT